MGIMSQLTADIGSFLRFAVLPASAEAWLPPHQDPPFQIPKGLKQKRNRGVSLTNLRVLFKL